jgi:site-specific DNA-methyltransferase (adenine-specific)
MPEQLLGRIIQACSRPGECVLDPFAGSGTTLAVAKKLGRDYLGYELSEEYAARAMKRLAAVQPGQLLDGAADPLTSAPSTGEGVRLEERQAGKRKRLRRRDDRKQLDLLESE